jgi:hypothetical protein
MLTTLPCFPVTELYCQLVSDYSRPAHSLYTFLLNAALQEKTQHLILAFPQFQRVARRYNDAAVRKALKKLVEDGLVEIFEKCSPKEYKIIVFWSEEKYDLVDGKPVRKQDPGIDLSGDMP